MKPIQAIVLIDVMTTPLTQENIFELRRFALTASIDGFEVMFHDNTRKSEHSMQWMSAVGIDDIIITVRGANMEEAITIAKDMFTAMHNGTVPEKVYKANAHLESSLHAIQLSEWDRIRPADHPSIIELREEAVCADHD